MNEKIRHMLLPATVFLTGASVLVVEVVATRVLSPYFGNTIFSVSSVISVILAALSVGYYSGGKLADKYPSLKWFFSIILISSFILMGLHGFGQFLLPLISAKLPITTGPLLMSMLLFFLPALLLGTLSPFAIKLQQTLTPKQGIGSISGTMFFWSTLGSIAGSLSAGFYFIPHVGINQIMIGNSILLFLVGLIPLLFLRLSNKKFIASIILFLVFAASTTFASNVYAQRYVYQADGVYERLSIYDIERDDRPTRILLQDSTNSGATYLDTNNPSDFTYDYTKYLHLYQEQNTPIDQALVIGGGPYSIPKALLFELPEASVDVVEIEPSLVDLAKTYFDLSENEHFTNIIQDGRRFLFDSKDKYDLIFADAYGSLYSVPSHLTTQEFMQLAHDRLSENGIFIGNFIGDTYQDGPSIIFSAMKTFNVVFDRTYYFGVQSPTQESAQNIIFLGVKNGQEIDFQNPLFKDHLIDTTGFDLSKHKLLTDNFAPVEYLSAQTLKRQTKHKVKE